MKTWIQQMEDRWQEWIVAIRVNASSELQQRLVTQDLDATLKAAFEAGYKACLMNTISERQKELGK